MVARQRNSRRIDPKPSQAKLVPARVCEQLRAGREFFHTRAWSKAYQSLSLADQACPLEMGDLQQLATSAYLTGRELEFQHLMDRAHRIYIGDGNRQRAARCGFWLALSLLLQGETAQASGWLTRAQRLVEGSDCAECGYLLLPLAEQHLGRDDAEAAHSVASSAVEIGQRFGDLDLVACARHLQGRALIRKQQVATGLALLDEAMLAVVAGELSPIVTGLIYCSVIDACQQVFALSRAREWTSALKRWCEQQTEMVAFTATCLVHRAEIMRLDGSWQEAMEEACRACEPPSTEIRNPPASAFYQRAEVYRLRGEFAAAEENYRSASRLGREPQPGLALLRLAQGRTDAACAAIRRVLNTTTDPLRRAKLLPAQIEILLAVGELAEASTCCIQLHEIAAQFDGEVLQAMSAHAQGALELAEGRAHQALGALRRAFELWQQVQAPYDAARVRVLSGIACRELGDHEASELELDAARAVFERLGAAPDLDRLTLLRVSKPHQHPLTARELEVLRLIAGGKTNKAIATALHLSDRTIDRHVSNILTKLNVPSRAAATAYAYHHKLL